MNKKAQELNLLGQAGLFIILFFLGGIIGSLSLPEFQGRFYVSGLVFAAFAMGLGKLVIHHGR